MGGYAVITIRMSGSRAEEELRSLVSWLQDEPAVCQYCRISLAPGTHARPEEMGAVFEAVQLAVDSGFQILNLALAYASWRSTRPLRPEVTIERDGTKVSIDGADTDVVTKIISALD